MKTLLLLLLTLFACAPEPVDPPQRDAYYGFDPQGQPWVVADCPAPYLLTVEDSTGNSYLLFEGQGYYRSDQILPAGVITLRLVTDPLTGAPCRLVHGCLDCRSTWTAVLKFVNP